MQVDQSRIESYLTDIVAEVNDIESLFSLPDDEILKDPRAIKSLKYSIVVIAEAVGSVLQHILAKNYRVAVRGYTDAYLKAKESGVVEEALIDRLQGFARFRNMLVHRYWRVEDRLFLENIRAGTRDFHAFVKSIKEAYIKKGNVEKSVNS